VQAGSAEADANGDLPTAADAACEHECGDVAAGDCHEQRHHRVNEPGYHDHRALDRNWNAEAGRRLDDDGRHDVGGPFEIDNGRQRAEP
jgi:hypothetical protein